MGFGPVGTRNRAVPLSRVGVIRASIRTCKSLKFILFMACKVDSRQGRVYTVSGRNECFIKDVNRDRNYLQKKHIPCQ